MSGSRSLICLSTCEAVAVGQPVVEQHQIDALGDSARAPRRRSPPRGRGSLPRVRRSSATSESAVRRRRRESSGRSSRPSISTRATSAARSNGLRSMRVTPSHRSLGLDLGRDECAHQHDRRPGRDAAHQAQEPEIRAVGQLQIEQHGGERRLLEEQAHALGAVRRLEHLVAERPERLGRCSSGSATRHPRPARARVRTSSPSGEIPRPPRAAPGRSGANNRAGFG